MGGRGPLNKKLRPKDRYVGVGEARGTNTQLTPTKRGTSHEIGTFDHNKPPTLKKSRLLHMGSVALNTQTELAALILSPAGRHENIKIGIAEGLKTLG